MSTIEKYLIIGGSGSGKSDFAQRLAARCGEPVIYLATGRAEGPEMAWRIQKHQESRPSEWRTIEAPRYLARALEEAAGDGPTVLLEDIGSLVASCLPHVDERDGEMVAPGAEMEQVSQVLHDEVDAIITWCEHRGKHLVIVSSEVGLGLLPMAPVSRLYKDALGKINQEIVQRVDRTFLAVAGLVIDLSETSKRIEDELGLT